MTATKSTQTIQGHNFLQFSLQLQTLIQSGYVLDPTNARTIWRSPLGIYSATLVNSVKAPNTTEVAETTDTTNSNTTEEVKVESDGSEDVLLIPNQEEVDEAIVEPQVSTTPIKASIKKSTTKK